MKRNIWKSILVTRVLVVVLALHACRCSSGDTVVILIRHAEKSVGSDNPDLTEQGTKRARALSKVVEDAGVQAVFSTKFCRTVQTVQPFALESGLPIHLVANKKSGLGECKPSITARTVELGSDVSDSKNLVQYILDNHMGQVVLVAGHSNTIPELVELLGAGPLCPEYFPLIDGSCRIPDSEENSEYDNVFTVIVSGKDKSARTIKSKYWRHD